ncbi:MAG TPA: hypothetical protein VG759_04465 [Candidatus Angelobacter sp.]|jgi:hypothetical protein|nr:hypothetical protein [Candidatus Angelobacter sp.]
MVSSPPPSDKERPGKTSAAGRVQLIEHRGKQILFVDYVNCDATTLKELILEGHRALSRMPLKSALTLNDVTGTYFDQESVRLLKETVVKNDPYVKRGAVIGISGLQSLIYSAVQAFSHRKIPHFSSKEEALDWLVQD